MIGRKAEAVLNRAVRYAVEREHEYFTLEHVLWSLLAERTIADTVEACGGDVPKLLADLEGYLGSEIPKALATPGASDVPAADSESDDSGADFHDPSPGSSPDQEHVEHPVATLSIQRLIQRALFHVQSAGKDEIQPIDLFIAMFQAKDSHALYSLGRQGIERLDVLNFVSHGYRKIDESPQRGPNGEQAEHSHDFTGSGEEAEIRPRKPGNPQPGTLGDDPLAQYSVNLNDRVRAGKIDPLVGRAPELERIIQTLCRRRKNNPLLVGEAGVGKTALAEGLALRIVEKKVPAILEKAVVYALDMGALLAGAKFRGDFEQRLKKVISVVQAKADRGLMPILLIDEIHTIVGAGSVSGGALDAANLLKPVLAQGDIRFMGSTTFAEYRSTFEKDHALARRFQKIDIAEPTQEEAIQILNGLKSRFEQHHGVTYTGDAIRSAVELSSKHLTDRFLPDKAIDVIDEAGAKARIKGTPNATIDAGEIEEVVAQIARIPARSVNAGQKQRLKNLERDLKLTIFGQDHAIDALVTSIRLARSGLRTGERPVGSFLFCGPTGVGKTELSKQLGKCLGIGFLRFDMSEYSERHTLSRLIGAPPGYVGFEQAGLLTDAVLKNPHAIVLLDEIEKAHFDIWNILLQIMDHGTLTDNNGRKVDFRNVILIMTSNVGSRDLERRALGLGAGDTKGSASSKEVERTFSPEFRNRLDATVYFNPLDMKTMEQVVNKQVLELESQLIAKGVEVEVTHEAREWLAKNGYDRQMGARPLGRLMQDKIKKPLAEEILFGKLEGGGEVKILTRMSDGKAELEFEIKPKPGSSASSSSDATAEQVEAPH